MISCPSCARQQFDVISTVATIEERLSHIDVPMTVSIIGCVVNGPGEARETDIGPDICLACLARTVYNTSDNRHRHRHINMGQPLFNRGDGADHIKLLARTGRA